MKRMVNILRAWVPLAVVTTGVCALAYVTVQQALRQDANDPQIQLAEDAAAALNAGSSPEGFVPKPQVEFSTSLAPFIVVYGADGKPVASSGLLDGQMPDYPMGALEAAKQTGENRVTWQPNNDVRVASVAVPYKDGYVVAGRNLREVEKRESQTGILTAALWILTLAAAFVVVAAGELTRGFSKPQINDKPRGGG